MGKLVVAANDKGIKFILWIQISIFIIDTAGNFFYGVCIFFLIHDLFFQHKGNIIGVIHHFRDNYLKEVFIFRRNIVEGMSLIRRNHNNDNIIPYIIKTERFNPGIIRNVSKFIFFSDCFLDFFPFFLDYIHIF